MDNFIFVSQSGCGERTSRQRKLVRAHVTRKYWQEVKGVKKISSLHAAKRKSKTDFLDGDSYELFQHYGSEFNMVLCNSIQPIPIDGPVACCTLAIQLHSPALLHAICFQAAAHVALRQATVPLRSDMFRNPDHSCGLEPKVLHHKAKALNDLRECLNSVDGTDPPSETSILCIAILLAAEAMMGDAFGLQSHTNGLSQLIAARGGLHVLSSSTASLVRFVDVKASIAQRRAPNFERKSDLRQEPYYSPPLTTTSRMTDGRDILNFGQGFMRPGLRTLMCPALLRCISQIKCLTLGSLRLPEYGQNAATYDIDDFITMDHALLSLKYLRILSTLEECARLALLIFTNTALWRIPLFFNCIRNPVADLKATLLLLDLEATNTHCTGLLLWITLLGRYVSRTSSTAESCWWSGKVRELAARAGLTTFHEARHVVTAFAYIDEVYAPAWEQIWNDNVLRWSQGFRTGLIEAERPNRDIEDHPCDYCK